MLKSCQGSGRWFFGSQRCSGERSEKRERRPVSQTKQPPDDLFRREPEEAPGPVDPVDVQKIRLCAEEAEDLSLFFASERREGGRKRIENERINGHFRGEERSAGGVHPPEGFLQDFMEGGTRQCGEHFVR